MNMNNKEFLKELKKRLSANDISKNQIFALLKNDDIVEEIVHRSENGKFNFEYSFKFWDCVEDKILIAEIESRGMKLRKDAWELNAYHNRRYLCEYAGLPFSAQTDLIKETIGELISNN